MILVRSLFRSRRVQVERVRKVRSIGYSGLLNRSSQSRFFKMLQLDLNEGELDIPSVVGRSGFINDLADRINNWLAETPTGPQGELPRIIGGGE